MRSEDAAHASRGGIGCCTVRLRNTGGVHFVSLYRALRGPSCVYRAGPGCGLHLRREGERGTEREGERVERGKMGEREREGETESERENSVERYNQARNGREHN